VRHLHFPNPKGIKADQMNYAVQRFSETFPEWGINSTFFAFYDCDSRPGPLVFDVFFQEIQKAPECNVLQQSSAYFKNFSQLGGSSFFRRYLLRAQAVRQTRFSFAYEIPRIRRVYDYCAFGKGRALGSATFAPCIAHGLFVRGSLFASVPFPSGHVVEDMFWGFLLTARKEPIRCMPCLDSAEIPMTVKGVFKQMARWFQGPFSTFHYARWIQRHEPKVFEQHRLRIRKLQMFGLYDAFVWAITLPVIGYLVLASVVFGPIVAVPFVAWIALYQMAGILIMRRYVPSSERTAWNTTITALFGVLALAVYSFAAHYSIVRLLLGRSLYFKTERQ
jgi:cellulose synthase/poly-beta-1,6-N-acetylglucosamine synthase-like glycosyltransferase